MRQFGCRRQCTDNVCSVNRLDCKLQPNADTAGMGARIRKPQKVHVDIRMNESLLIQVDGYASSIGRTRTEVIHRAIEEYLGRQRQQQSASQHPDRGRGRENL